MNNRKQDAVRCRKINEIRDAARASLAARGHAPFPADRAACPTCGRSAGNAHARGDDRGRVVEGCVDAYHAGQHATGERARWWSRPEAQAIRAAELARLEAL